MPLTIILLLAFPILSATCKKLNECVELSSHLTGQKIIYDKKLIPFTYELNTPIEMTKENVDSSLSEALNVFGLAKVPTTLKDTSKIIEAREIRFHNDLPSFQANKNSTPTIPETHDPVMLTYKGVKGTDMEVIESKIRSMLSRYGRAMPMRDHSLVIIDIASHVKRIVPVLQKQDFPLTAEEKAALELQKRREHELELARLKSGDLHEIGPHRHKDH
jgi:hypothetical protein